MSAGTSEFFCLICLLLCSCTAQKIITAKRGQDVILPCKVSNKYNINNIRAVGWIRPGLDPRYIFLYRDGRFDPDNQHPSYQNRVDLQDKEMKNGDFSLILKNVKMEDTGKYVCWVPKKGKNKLISIITLEVLPPDHSWKIIVGVVVPLVVIILSVVGFAIYKKLQNRKMKKKMQEEIKRLERNNPEIINLLQKEKQENEALKNEVEKLMRSHSDPSSQLQLVKQRNEILKNRLKERAASDEKLKTLIQNNIQEDENQKLMKTVGNLKTELQNMNQELEQMGIKTEEEGNLYSYYI